MSLVRGILLKHGQYSDRYQIDDVSYYYIADEISRSQFAFDEVINRKQWQVFATVTSNEFIAPNRLAHTSLAEPATSS